MRHYRLTPKDWNQLPRIDKKILYYSLIMERHYEALAYEKQQKDMDRKRREDEARSRAMGKMPALQRGRRR